ncbi:hypothetical protein [Sorangium sp. So ce1000]|uniref:hypothetical protein n=1 Tax=Sorangium sp. So ce1000 TaxID=3133325 RepID=UPI003F61EC0E
MIVVIDPALLLTDSAALKLPESEERALSDLLDDAARICRNERASIPSVDWYWGKLQRELARPLLPRLRGPRVRQGLDYLQSCTRHVHIAGPPSTGQARVWGIKELFEARKSWARLPPDWLDIMLRLFIGCAQLDDETLLITRLFAGRNMKLHAVQKCTLTEKTRWRVYIHVSGRSPQHIRCVRNLRNLYASWTTRLDEKLPDRGRFPFCPPRQWWLRDTEVHRSVQSKPGWVDAFRNGWVQPATGGDNHWDVFLQSAELVQNVGVNQINVVAWGTKESGMSPGDFHHIPKDKKPHVNTEASWSCPPENS